MSTAHTPIGPFPGRPTAATPTNVSWSDKSQVVPLALLIAMVVGLVIAYLDMFDLCAHAWSTDQYSHGWLIPLGSIIALYLGREYFVEVPTRERWYGVGLILLGYVIRIASGMFYSHPVDRISFMVSLFGVFILVGGFYILRWSWAWLAFLVFMFPLPSVLERKVLGELKTFATIVSVGVLQTLGFSAYREGNVITIDQTTVEVADVCSGLRMATVLIAMSFAVALLIKRPWWDKLILIVCAIPTAIFVNIVRITVTAIVYWAWPESETAKHWVHDGAGYAMPILALGIVMLTLGILERLSVVDDGGQVRTMAVPGPRMPVAK